VLGSLNGHVAFLGAAAPTGGDDRTRPPDRSRRRAHRRPAPAVGRPCSPAADSGVRLSPAVPPEQPPKTRPCRPAVVSALVLAGALCLGLAAVPVAPPAMAANGAAAPPASAPSSGGPAPAYRCALNVDTGAFTGAFGTASAIGWLGDHNSVITCLGGTFLIQDGPQGYFVNYGFGLYAGQKTTWRDADGYLPAQVTSFDAGGAAVAITEFADRIDVGGHPYVAVYSRVRVANHTAHALTVDPQPSSSLVPLDTSPDTVQPRKVVDHDYVVVSDRFGASYPWPGAAALTASGGFDAHFEHMRAFWEKQLSAIAQVSLPNASLVDAYKSGFITTQITRSGNHLDTGVNGYESEYSHDVVGILTNLFTQGSFTDAHALLTDVRSAVGAQASYVDGLWTYPLPWAVYLLKTGDTSFVRQNFATSGPAGASAEPSLEEAAHAIAADRTGPMGTMEATQDIDTQGTWTVDDYEALLGLAAYHYIASRLGEQEEAAWASQQYASLLAATNAELTETIAANHLDYLPCSLVQPNTANRCSNPRDANWTSPFGFGAWAWEAGLLGAPVNGPGLTMIDATYTYGFGRLEGLLPADTTGGFPDDFYSSAYNAETGMAGLASQGHRDQGILNYEFMLANTQSGPFSWWESSSAPDPGSPWVGPHPGSGQGASPHAWGIAGANKVLLDSLVAQETSGSLVVGRGIPPAWLRTRRPISVGNFPTTRGRRLALTVVASGRHVTLSLRGTAPGPVRFELPSFVHNVAATTSGTVSQSAGIVTIRPTVHSVTVTLRRTP
jgi:hypothetical protein